MDWKSWPYKNLTILATSFLLSLIIGFYKPFHEPILATGYWGAFLSGVFFIFTFVTPIAAVILLILAQEFPIPALLLFSGIGAIFSDFTLFRNFKDGIAEEIEPLIQNFDRGQIKALLKTKHFRRLDPVLGAIIILTPLPKNLGLRLIGIHKLRTTEFLAVSAIVNIIGIFFILLLSFVIKL